MIKFNTALKRFESQGEKTGWTFIEITPDLAEALNGKVKTSYRVKGKIDKHVIKGVALVPMGGGSFILAVNATMRKAIAKKVGAMVDVQLQTDKEGYVLNADFVSCLKDEPEAYSFFNSLAKGHQNYFSKWIDDAKTDPTKSKRIAQAVSGLLKGWGYPEMIRANKQTK